MSVSVRLTGVTTPSEALVAVKAGYTMIAMVFDKNSRRCQTPEVGAVIRQIIPKNVDLTAIVRDMPDEELYDIVRLVKPNILELQGEESPARSKLLRHNTGCKVMKTIRVLTPEDMALAKKYTKSVDWLLFDVRPNKNNPLKDVTLRFDWKLFQELHLPIPWILSGGLDLDNVQTILKLSGARYINVCSGVEPTPGRKDPQLIEEFIKNVAGDNRPSPENL